MSWTSEGGEAKGTDSTCSADGCALSEGRLRRFTNPPPGYYNPMLAYGEEKAIQDEYEAGANGFIMVDLPPEEAIVFREKCRKAK